jgi:hypothetical protein
MPRMLASFLLTAVLFPIGLSAQDTTKPAPKIKRNPDLITAQEIAVAPEAARTALDLVKQLRPLWLQTRGPSSISLGTPAAQVYVDGMHRGGPDTLTDVHRESIREIRHLRGTDASQRYGLNHENGAILVTTK